MNRLYAPDLANRYVWPCTSKTDKSIPRKMQYATTSTEDPERLGFEGYELAGPCQTGKYDSLGRYQVFLPPIPGHHGGLGRYVLHPWADQAIADANLHHVHGT